MNMQMIARGWLIYTLTSSALDLAWVTLSFMIPTVALSLFGGVLADRVQKRGIVALAQTLNCAATVIMAAIILMDRVSFWDFIWFGLFNGSVLALSMPARQAYVPEIVPERLIFYRHGALHLELESHSYPGSGTCGFSHCLARGW